MIKKLSIFFLGCTFLIILAPFTSAENPKMEGSATFMQAVINTDEAIQVNKSTIFDASQSFIGTKDKKDIQYQWDFGDGLKKDGAEVLHTYQNPGKYNLSIKISDGVNSSEKTIELFVYKKLLVLITDQTDAQDRIEIVKNYAEKAGVFIKVFESFGSATEFISEEVLAKKLNEESQTIQKVEQLVIWTKENTGLNAISRYIQNNVKKSPVNFSQKNIIVISNNVQDNQIRIQNQFNLIKPKEIVVSKEAAIYPLIESSDENTFLSALKKGGYEYKIIDTSSGKIRPWNFMSYFVNFLINQGIPDNTIALLLLLPVIAAVVSFMRQVVGITTFGVYTPSIITLSFLIIGLPAGLLTLFTAILISSLIKPVFKKVRMLFIPQMAIIITVVSLALFFVLIFGIYLGLFDAEFLSLAIFPMLILSTLAEKFISIKAEKGLTSAILLMLETVIVSIIAFIFVGGDINLGFFQFKFDFIKNILISLPETVFIFLIINIILGRWTGLRLLEMIRFREIFRNIEE